MEGQHSTTNFKLGTFDCSSREISHTYPDSWAAESMARGPDRLVIGPASHHIGVIRELCLEMEEPFGLLYVLVVPRSQQEAGRYQSPYPISKEDLFLFLTRFERFFESDGRHHLWIASVGEPDLLVYDRHNLIYAYGHLDAFRKVLTARAFAKTSHLKIPSPHIHRYHAEYDGDAEQLLEYWNWIRFPLEGQDDE